MPAPETPSKKTAPKSQSKSESAQQVVKPAPVDPEDKAARRQKREQRREKQRAVNGTRAKKMHQARLEYEAGGRKPAAPRLKSQVYIGCSGWFYWHWRGAFYPETLPTKDWFSHYKKSFKTVELNAPFYAWPTAATVKTWRRQTGRRQFVYTVKVSELITHIKRFQGTATLIRDFAHIAELLGPAMGCFVFQLPPSFKYTEARMKGILKQLVPGQRNVLEFRHPSWWNEKVYKAFRKAGVIFCSSSGPRLPDELIKTADEIYIRFHGTKNWYRHNYSKEEISIWAQRIKDSGAKRVWAYFNNDRDGHAIRNAKDLARQLTAQKRSA